MMFGLFKKKESDKEPEKQQKKWINPHRANYKNERKFKVRYRFGNKPPSVNYVRSVVAGLDAWTKTNPWLLFVQVSERDKQRATLMIKFRNGFYSGACGKALMGTFPRGIIWLDRNMDIGQVALTTAHEFGHIVGYGHSGGGLMKGAGDYTADMPKSRKFKLPRTHIEYDKYTGHETVWLWNSELGYE